MRVFNFNEKREVSSIKLSTGNNIIIIQSPLNCKKGAFDYLHNCRVISEFEADMNNVAIYTDLKCQKWRQDFYEKYSNYTITYVIFYDTYYNLYCEGLDEELSKYTLAKISGDMMDCHNLYQIINSTNNYDLMDTRYLNTDVNHRSLYHLESVKTHIELVTENAKKTNNLVLIDAARYHDFGKFMTRNNSYSGCSYKNHDKLSGYITLSNLYNETKNYEHSVLTSIVVSQHMIAHDYYNFDKSVIEPLAIEFTKCDEEAKLQSNVVTCDQGDITVNLLKDIKNEDYLISIIKFICVNNLDIEKINYIIKDFNYFNTTVNNSYTSTGIINTGEFTFTYDIVSVLETVMIAQYYQNYEEKDNIIYFIESINK